MVTFLFLLAIFLPADEQHSIASKVLDAVLVEVEAVESHVTANPVAQMLEMKVVSVGLGAEILKGKAIQANYGVGLRRIHPIPGFTPTGGKPFPKGKKLVVYVRWIGTNREPWIMDAWAEGEKKTFDSGMQLIAKLKDVNDAKTEEELTDRIFYTLLKKNEASEFVGDRVGLGLRFSRKEVLMSLLNRVAESEKLPEERRNVLKDMLKRAG